MKNSKLRIPVLLLVYVLIPVVFIGLYFIGNLYSVLSVFEPYNLSIAAGAAAYIVFMSQFLISARLRFLERIFGQDRLLGMHGSVGLVSGALVLTHFILKFLLVLRFGSPTPQSALGFLALLTFAVLAPAAYLVLQGRRLRIGRWNYRKARFAHNFFALAGLAAVVHVMLATTTWSVPLKAVTLIWGILALGAYVWHKILRPNHSIRLELAEYTEAAPGLHRFRLAVKEGRSISAVEPVSGRAGGALFQGRRSGQFAYFNFECTDPAPEEHPFTISSPPGEDLEIIVRNSGDYTALMNRIPPGTMVRVDGPYGTFHPWDLREGTPLLFLAGGIGITPFLSMARDSDLRRRHSITLVWSIARPEDEQAAKSLAGLAASGEISMKTVYTRTAPPGAAVSRIDDKLLGELLSKISGGGSGVGNSDAQALKQAGDVVCFLCGPGKFVREISAVLGRHGVPKSRIRSEQFSW